MRLRSSREVSPWLILGIAFAIWLVYAFPGYMSSDSAVQLTQARDHQYSDGHPPAMAALWTIVELFIAGPFGMLLVQGSLFLVGTYWLLSRHVGARNAAIAAGLIFVFPPILAPMAVIWKDSQMAGFLVMGIALLGARAPRRRWLGIVSLSLAVAMRHNALVAAFPIILVLWPGRPAQRPLVRLALATAVWLAATGAALGTNHLLTTVHDHTWHYSIGPDDIGGILANSKHHYTDDELLEILDGTPLVPHDHIQNHAKHIYNPTLWWYVMNGDQRLFDWPATDDQRAAITRAWKALALGDPGAYLLHRARVFRALIAFGPIQNPLIGDPVWRVKMNADQVNDAGPDAKLQRAIGGILEWFAKTTPIDRPYIYLLVSLMFLPIAWRHRDAFALLASGILYELTFLPLSPSSEFRYSHWAITCAVIAIVILVIERSRGVSAKA